LPLPEGAAAWLGADGAGAAGGEEAGAGASAGARGAAGAVAGAAVDGAADSLLEPVAASDLTARGLRTRFSAVSPASGVLSDKRVFLAKRRALASGERDVRDVVI